MLYEVITDRDALRWGLRTLFCSSPDDWDRFDDLYDAYWSYGGERTILKVSGTLARGGGNEAPAPGQFGLGGVDVAEPGEGGSYNFV